MLNKLKEYRWQLVTIMLLGAIINYVDRVNISFATTHLTSEFGLTPSQMGFLLAAWMWPYAAASIPSGWLIDKFGVSKIFVWSVILWSIATILSGVMHDYSSLYISRVFLGIAEAPFFVIAGKIIQLYFKDSERGLAASTINLGPKIANGFTPPLIAFLIILAGWRGMFLVLGVLGFAIVLLWFKIYKKNDNEYIIKD